MTILVGLGRQEGIKETQEEQGSAMQGECIVVNALYDHRFGNILAARKQCYICFTAIHNIHWKR